MKMATLYTDYNEAQGAIIVNSAHIEHNGQKSPQKKQEE